MTLALRWVSHPSDQVLYIVAALVSHGVSVPGGSLAPRTDN